MSYEDEMREHIRKVGPQYSRRSRRPYNTPGDLKEKLLDNSLSEYNDVQRQKLGEEYYNYNQTLS